MFSLFKKWWVKSQMSPVERYLSQSEDLVDLEQRQKRLNHNGYKVF